MNTPSDLLKVEADECAETKTLEAIVELVPGWEVMAVHKPVDVLALMTSETLAPITYRDSNDVGQLCDLLSGCIVRGRARPSCETVQDIQRWVDHMVSAGEPFVVIRKLGKPNPGMVRMLKKRKHFPTIGGSTWARRNRGE